MASFKELRNDYPVSEEVQRGTRPLREHPDAVAGSREQATLPLVDQVAYGFARALLIAINELETRIANENRKLGDAVGDRLGALQVSFKELSDNVSEQRAQSAVLENRCHALETETASLQQSDTRRQDEISVLRNDLVSKAASISNLLESSITTLQKADAGQTAEVASVRELISSEAAALRQCDANQTSEIARLQTETKAAADSLGVRITGLMNEITVQQEDIIAIKSTLKEFNSKFDVVLDRVEKQGEALHTMYTTYAQRESELERVIEGLTRLRAVPPPPAAPRL